MEEFNLQLFTQDSRMLPWLSAQTKKSSLPLCCEKLQPGRVGTSGQPKWEHPRTSCAVWGKGIQNCLLRGSLKIGGFFGCRKRKQVPEAWIST